MRRDLALLDLSVGVLEKRVFGKALPFGSLTDKSFLDGFEGILHFRQDGIGAVVDYKQLLSALYSAGIVFFILQDLFSLACVKKSFE